MAPLNLQVTPQRIGRKPEERPGAWDVFLQNLAGSLGQLPGKFIGDVATEYAVEELVREPSALAAHQRQMEREKAVQKEISARQTRLNEANLLKQGYATMDTIGAGLATLEAQEASFDKEIALKPVEWGKTTTYGGVGPSIQQRTKDLMSIALKYQELRKGGSTNPEDVRLVKAARKRVDRAAIALDNLKQTTQQIASVRTRGQSLKPEAVRRAKAAHSASLLATRQAYKAMYQATVALYGISPEKAILFQERIAKTKDTVLSADRANRALRDQKKGRTGVRGHRRKKPPGDAIDLTLPSAKPAAIDQRREQAAVSLGDYILPKPTDHTSDYYGPSLDGQLGEVTEVLGNIASAVYKEKSEIKLIQIDAILGANKNFTNMYQRFTGANFSNDLRSMLDNYRRLVAEKGGEEDVEKELYGEVIVKPLMEKVAKWMKANPDTKRAIEAAGNGIIAALKGLSENTEFLSILRQPYPLPLINELEPVNAVAAVRGYLGGYLEYQLATAKSGKGKPDTVTWAKETERFLAEATVTQIIDAAEAAIGSALGRGNYKSVLRAYDKARRGKGGKDGEVRGKRKEGEWMVYAEDLLMKKTRPSVMSAWKREVDAWLQVQQ